MAEFITYGWIYFTAEFNTSMVDSFFMDKQLISRLACSLRLEQLALDWNMYFFDC